MRTKIVTIIVLVVFATTALAYYFYFFGKEKLEVTEITPGGSVALLSVNNLEKVIKDLEGYDWWESVNDLPYLHQVLNEVEALRELKAQGKLQSQLTSLPFALSFHVTSSDKLEVLYFVKSKGFQWKSSNLQALLRLWKENEEISFKERLYGDEVIVEFEIDGKPYALLIYEDYLVYTTNALLIEDVVRTINGDATSLAQKKEGKTGSSKHEINLLVNLERLNDLYRVFVKNTASINDLKQKGVADLKVTFGENALLLTGFSSTESNKKLGEREETRFYEKYYLPEEILSVKIYGLPTHQNISNDSLLHSFDLRKFYSLHQGSVSLVDMDLNQQLKDRAILAHVNNALETSHFMSSLARDMSADEDDSVYQESFMEVPISFLGEKEIPSQIYGDEFTGFDQSYYAVFNDHLIIGNSIDAIKTILSAYDDENTWGRITHRRQFLDNLIASNYAKVVNFQLIREQLMTDLKPKWASLNEENPILFETIDLLAFQLSNATQGNYTVAQMIFNESVPTERIEENSPSPLELIANVFADTTISTRPFVVKNHITSRQEILFQDISNRLYLIGKDGSLRWKKQLDGPIRGGVHQIDFYKNKKLQYFFIADSLMYVIDRNGNAVEDFPRVLSTELPLTGTRVIDYDNSKRYRYTAVDRRGNIYLYDKSGELLEGWDPREGKGILLDVPVHVRVRGKDCFVFVQRNGIIHMTNRRGETYPGFPFDTNNRLAGDVFLQRGTDFNRSRITVTGEGGEIITIDFKGRVKTKKQLFKPNVASRFELVVDEMNTGYVILRKDANKVVCYNTTGENLFEYPIANTNQLACRFYNFRNDSEVYTFRNTESGEVSILDKNGKLKAQLPSTTDNPLGIVYYQTRSEYEVFVNFGNQFALYRLKK